MNNYENPQADTKELTLSDIKGVGVATVKKLHELGIYKPIDLLYFFPKSYIDLKLPVTILETIVGQFSVIYAEVLSVSGVNFKHKGTFSIKAKSGKGVFKVVFFNQPYLRNNFEVGKSYLFLGKVQFDGSNRVLFNPIYEKVDSNEQVDEKIDTNKIVDEKVDSNEQFKQNEKNVTNAVKDTAKNYTPEYNLAESSTTENNTTESSSVAENILSLDVGADSVATNSVTTNGNDKSKAPLFSENKLQGIFTVYATKGLISQNTFKKIISNCLKIFRPQTLLSDKICAEQNMLTLYESFRAVHLPKNLDEAENAKTRLAIEDVVNNLIFYQKFKKVLIKPRKVLYKTQYNRIVDCQNTVKNAIKSAFDFILTSSQEKAVDSIFNELSSDKLMNRIVAGDVGSGKTIVAFCAIYFVALSSRQSVMLAPTEILGRQHFEIFLQFSKSLGISACLLTASTKSDERKEILSGLADGSIDVCIGTHSVLSEKIDFRNLSLVIFDEQQRFGVAQRESLEQKGYEVDTLVLTATPIPRTLAMVLCGDLKVSMIYKRKDAVSNIKTRLVTDDNKQKMFSFIANECRHGKKALFVCPKLFDGEGLTIFSAEKLFKSLKQSEFSNIPIGLIHGKQPSAQKNDALQDLKEGRVLALVCTSVIEVGIDVPDILYIVILNADRFGLSQLHQIRGRAGRNGDEAFCFLHTERINEKNVLARLETLVNTMDGMEIATKDFELRGGGEFFGQSQSGASLDSTNQLKIDTSIIKKAKLIADKLLCCVDTGDSDVTARLNSFDFSPYYDSIIGVTNN